MVSVFHIRHRDGGVGHSVVDDGVNGDRHRVTSKNLPIRVVDNVSILKRLSSLSCETLRYFKLYFIVLLVSNRFVLFKKIFQNHKRDLPTS